MTSEERAEAKRMVQEALEESRDRIRAEKAEAALVAANEAWDRAWEKAMPRYAGEKAIIRTEKPVIMTPEKIRQEETKGGKDEALFLLYGVCTGAMIVMLMLIGILVSRLL